MSFMPCMFIVNELNWDSEDDPRDVLYFSPMELWLGVMRGCLVWEPSIVPDGDEAVRFVQDDHMQITMAPCT